MIPLLLGKDRDTDDRVFLDVDQLSTHMHLIGATGKGKTTTIHALLRALMLQVGRDEACIFVIDPMGNLSRDLLAFIAHPQFSTKKIRDRLVYIETAREDVVMSLNPLRYTTPANRYYQTMRAVDLVLRGWAAQDTSQQPRLLNWTFKTFCAAAEMGMPISMCRHLVHAGSPEHTAILDRLPCDIRHEWLEILNARGGEATKILESTRNRLDPFFRSPILRAMFGSLNNRFDCERFMRERKIVILNLAKMEKVPGLTADTIGALALNEIFETATRLTNLEQSKVVDPTYVLLDEFQKYISVDIEEALPTVRQMGLRMILAHQSFAQLDREDVNLEQMIWQAQVRMIYGSYAQDADLLADELAKLTFNSKKIKDTRISRRQLIAGYRKEWLLSEGSSESYGTGSSTQRSGGDNETRTFDCENSPWGYSSPKSQSHGKSESHADSSTDSRSSSTSQTRGQVMVPIHDNFEEATVEFENFEEFALEWGKKIRRQKKGEAFLQLPDCGGIIPIQGDYLPIEETKSLKAAIEELKQKNFESECFVSMDESNREYDQCWQEVLKLPLQGNSGSQGRHHDGQSVTIPRPDQAANDSPSGFTL